MTNQLPNSLTDNLLRQNKNYSSHKLRIIICAILSATLIIIFILPHLYQSNHKTNPQYQSIISINTTGHAPTPNHEARIVKSYFNIQNSNPRMVKVDKSSRYLSRFTINGLQIVYQEPSRKWTQLVAYKPIPYNQTYKIKLLISFTSNSHIIIGITNHQRIHQQSSFFNQDTYAYYGQNGCLWAEGRLMEKDQIGYKQKDIVQLDVLLSEGIIQWKVNEEIRGQIFSKNLKSQNKKFVPYIQMLEKKDSIRIIV